MVRENHLPSEFPLLSRHAACEVVSVHEEHMPSVTVMSDFEDEVS